MCLAEIDFSLRLPISFSTLKFNYSTALRAVENDIVLDAVFPIPSRGVAHVRRNRTDSATFQRNLFY